MLNVQQINEFHENGYLLIDSVFDSTQVAALRKEVVRLFQTLTQLKMHPRDTPTVKYDLAHRYPGLKWMMFHGPIVSMIKSLLGESYYTPLTNICVQKANYSRWHRDTDYWEIIGHYEHYQPHFLMVNLVVYLQDNHPEYGGGLDVVVGSHKNMNQAQSVPMEQPAPAYFEAHPPFSIPSKKGSLILFDQRVRHKATTPTVDLNAVPTEKMGIFWTVTPNNEHLSHYYTLIENLYGYQVTYPVINA